MKLRNKKTGEIKEVIVDGYPVIGKTKMWECSEKDFNEETGYKSLGTYTSLAELNEEWEDYEEPKEYWRIDCDGEVLDDKYEGLNFDNDCKAIGNYFETKEEAEKAVEKLKAWKRLKDKGFRFCGWATNEGIRGVDFEVPDSFFSEHNNSCISDETRVDLNLLFGGEE